MKIIKLALGELTANCYLLFEQKQCLIIDPGAEAAVIKKKVGPTPVAGIVLTHGHFDHIGAVNELATTYGCLIYVSPADQPLLNNPTFNYSDALAYQVTQPLSLITASTLTIGPFQFKVYFTPGHTAGSICLEYKKHLFTGDTLFQDDVGRTDLYSGSDVALYHSLKKLKLLSPELKILPGHGPNSTLAIQLQNNPYLRD